jgi:hypothetical protein
VIGDSHSFWGRQAGDSLTQYREEAVARGLQRKCILSRNGQRENANKECRASTEGGGSSPGIESVLANNGGEGGAGTVQQQTARL